MKLPTYEEIENMTSDQRQEWSDRINAESYKWSMGSLVFSVIALIIVVIIMAVQ
jgi:hypothetical protein